MKTRIAPSPSGYMHLGTLRTALINYVAAKANNLQFQLRIDDTNLDKQDILYYEDICKQMNRFGLVYDETFKQSDNLQLYQDVAKAIGIKRNDDSYYIEYNNEQITILRPNGYPLYNFATVVDDYYTNVSLIIRGVDHISNLPLQKYIFDLLCKTLGDKIFPDVKHLGLLLDDKGNKLSKSLGNGNISTYSEYKDEAILNWLFKYGWSSKQSDFDKHYKYLSLTDMIKHFNNGNLNSKNSKLDINKLKT